MKCNLILKSSTRLLSFLEQVLFDFQVPAVEEDKQIIISYQEFYDIVYKYYSEYASQHSEEQDEIMRLLAELKNKLNVKQ